MTEQAKPEERRCMVCGDRLNAGEPQTCTPCLGDARRALLDIETMYALLPLELIERAGAATPWDAAGGRSGEAAMPGGDVLVLMAGGSVVNRPARQARPDMPADRSHFKDEDPVYGDAPSVLAVLASWEDDWRHTQGQPVAGRATLSGVARYLGVNLGWAAQSPDTAFDEFASDIRQLRARLARATHHDHPHERARIACPDCGHQLWKPWGAARPCEHPGRPHCDHSGHRSRWRCGGGYCPCDQGGRRDVWYCRSRDCGRIVEEDEYWLLIRGVLDADNG